MERDDGKETMRSSLILVGLPRYEDTVEARGFFLSILISFFFYFSGPINRINRFKKLPAPYKALIISSAVAFLVLFSIAVAYCCRRKRATTTGHVKVMPPSYDEATSTKTKVPMQPLVNEI